ncbi:hypothetical protein B0T25DRAFT_546395 [Lasiosphaeria hispida]|uniref:Uncharacterized protein n=1 Tax=Lasiosphaeria hispida TaxID=260671 RepID=A0AAJ0MC22_9PEZI|nr:hypothetical protein B0T25DRAFT_546395 [Lasiosphaeria hispida]
MASDALRTPYQTYHHKSYAAIDPTRPALSTRSKSAVVTGAGSGIGASIALSLAKSGVSQLALLGRRVQALEKTKSAVLAVSPSLTQVFVYPVDVTDAAAVDAALNAFAGECVSSHNKIDILVANAGTLGALEPLTTADPVVWWEGFEVNVRGNFNLVRAFLPRASREGGSVVYISSAAAHGPPYLPNQSSYSVSKAGATKMFECLRFEHPDLFVLSVQPGLVGDTGMSAGFEHVARGLQMDMADLPWDDVALPGDFVVWAVSPEARFLSGRFVWANWDVEELKADRDAILADPRKFTQGLVGHYS